MGYEGVNGEGRNVVIVAREGKRLHGEGCLGRGTTHVKVDDGSPAMKGRQ